MTINTFYHVTSKDNVQPILKEGLVPKIGPRSSKQGEPTPAVYLFSSRELAEDAVANWLGDEFDEQMDLSLLKVRVNSEDLVKTSMEWISFKPIAASNIKLVCLEM